MKQSKNKSSLFVWLGLGTALLGLWSQRYRIRQGRISSLTGSVKPGKALITGASSGIGAAFARQLAARGFHLILVARKADRLQALANEIQEMCGVSVDVIPADLADPNDVQLLERTIRAQNQIDLLVNNAGFGAPGPFAKSNISRQLDMIKLHDLAAVALVYAALPGMIARGRGGIINTSSTAAFFPLPHNASYSASKVFLNNFSESLQMELDGSGIYVQALCPGFTITEFHDQISGFKRNNLPSFLWMQADEVVRQSLDSLGSGEVIFVPGWINRVIASFGPNEFIRGLIKWGAKRYTTE